MVTRMRVSVCRDKQGGGDKRLRLLVGSPRSQLDPAAAARSTAASKSPEAGPTHRAAAEPSPAPPLPMADTPLPQSAASCTSFPLRSADRAARSAARPLHPKPRTFRRTPLRANRLYRAPCPYLGRLNIFTGTRAELLRMRGGFSASCCEVSCCRRHVGQDTQTSEQPCMAYGEQMLGE
ncbi:unnamed protein product [Pleuronectes platessa]|uniref:Uncharacterized protein n=1 Tax=Pleuronectes platessa TaxID=8262 RepID=A0A9N7YBE8_PLEPL|nr:unnamed protein product [Pleuronectes platessa]